MTLASSYLGALDCKLLMGVTEVTQNHWRQLQKRPLNSLNHEIAWISTGIEDHSLKINISTFLLLHPILLRALQKTTWSKCQTLKQRSVSSIRPVGDLRFLKAAWRSSWGPLLTPAIGIPGFWLLPGFASMNHFNSLIPCSRVWADGQQTSVNHITYYPNTPLVFNWKKAWICMEAALGCAALKSSAATALLSFNLWRNTFQKQDIELLTKERITNAEQEGATGRDMGVEKNLHIGPPL